METGLRMVKHPTTRQVACAEMTKPRGDSTGEEMWLKFSERHNCGDFTTSGKMQSWKVISSDTDVLPPPASKLLPVPPIGSQLARKPRRSHPRDSTSRQRYWLKWTDSILLGYKSFLNWNKLVICLFYDPKLLPLPKPYLLSLQEGKDPEFNCAVF